MQKLRLHWEFFKSTIILNLASSVLFAAIIGSMSGGTKTTSPLIVNYINCCMFGGPLVSFYYKELSRKKEYYFYYNRGITKIKLLTTTYITYILTGLVILIILNYAQFA